MCLCYISLIAAVTAAVPVNGSSSVPFIRRIQGCQPAETSSGDIHSVPARRTCQAPAAFYLPCFQVMCCYIFFLSTGTSAPPAGSSAFVFDPVKDRQPAEYTAGQVFCFSASHAFLFLRLRTTAHPAAAADPNRSTTGIVPFVVSPV